MVLPLKDIFIPNVLNASNNTIHYLKHDDDVCCLQCFGKESSHLCSSVLKETFIN